ncbi:alpha helical protein [Salinarimonas ramus]|uniref:Uncharacterized protein n=1 Tax=Salinarimonas ramus TaxID=690164 RepID=A0A917QK83_9HYPH|nr:alpha helical protein [Salinarimonas ramus]GGK54561.1 hypothetical protein GCM10011322_46680 [Salinarimonas ramus]
MAAHAGETERETGDVRCERHHETAHVTDSDEIPRCQNCGNDTVDAGRHAPGMTSS